MADIERSTDATKRIEAPLNFDAVLPICWQRDNLTSKLCNTTEACLHG